MLPRYISVDKNGKEYEFLPGYFDSPSQALENVFLKGYEWPFDVRKIHGSSYIDLLVYRENVILGREVYMDFTREPSGIGDDFEGIGDVAYNYLKNSDALLPLPIKRLERMNPGAISLYAEHGIDLYKEPLKIAVCAQHNNGGVRIDSNWQTNIKGLYAIGEAAGSLGIFRPGGSALNSCQVGGLRAAQHIVYESDNKVSQHYEQILSDALRETRSLIDATSGEKSTLARTREKYQKRMSRDFAFLRDISSMTGAAEEISRDLNGFIYDNKWKDICEIPMLFKNLDIIRMQEVISKVILETAKSFGSRGSAFVLDGGSFMDRSPLPEEVSGREKIIVARGQNGKTNICSVPIRPIPDAELWFEKAWNRFRERTHES